MEKNNENLMIDSHAHLNFQAFKNDLEKVIEKTLNNNVWFINVGSNYDTSLKAVEIAEGYEKGIYASIGLHPIHVVKEFVKTDNQDNDFEKDFIYQKYKKIAKSKKVVAIGETGLDYYYKPKNKDKLNLFKEKQKKVLAEHLDLAQESNLPVIFHCRMAHRDLIDILKLQKREVRGVIHCFTGTWEEAKQYLEMGLYIGFTGIIFKLNLEEVIRKIPLNRILAETDCPYLVPPQVANISERNEPIFVKYVIQEISRIKKLSFQEVLKNTTQNTIKLFNLK